MTKEEVKAEKIEFLREKMEAGLTTPQEAHKALKKKFGKSLTFAEVAAVLRGQNPASPKNQRKKKARSKSKKKGHKRVVTPRATKPTPGTKDHEYLVRSNGTFTPVGSKSDVETTVAKLIKAGDPTPSVYKRIRYKTKTTVKV